MVINLFDFFKKLTHYQGDTEVIQRKNKTQSLLSAAIKMTDDAQQAAARVNFELERLEKIRIV